ncbi:hypothetical protein G9C85_02635 [Halorubellus sp. JP-L1]|uniref:hypothetical protein n=1 Tax=Halorubellus sp. JP-L1 TaxID=2715753 RepID=UPI00140E46E7|nr:hypothetical protein [Halorubellus sp. JP-L1]NHN40535.1 hypothetical protein [Halorubellus sp. JP-L1]
MPETLQFSTLVFPQAGRDRQERSNRQNIAAEGALAGGASIVEDISSLPGEQTLSGAYLGDYAKKQTDELDELVSSPDIGPIPVFAPDGETSLAGYYVLESGRTNPETAQSDSLQRFDVGLTQKGTRNKHWRMVATNPTQVQNDFGSTQASRVAVPGAASKVQWVDRETGETALASGDVVATASGEWADVDLFDPYTDDPLGASEPALIYDVPYDVEEGVDVRVWDTRGHDSKLDSDGDVQWSKVFSPDHDYSGNLVADTGRLRVTFDEEGSPGISAQRWNAVSEAWESVSPSTTDWEVLDVDVVGIGLERVDAYVLFSNLSTGDIFALDAAIKRGLEDVLWTIPGNSSGPVPSGLDDLLDPTASPRVIDASESKQLHSRRSTRE